MSRSKVLREDLAEDPDFVRRFPREAEALARLDHPNIVRFYSFEQCAAQAFIVMDYVPGSTLSRRLREVAGPLPAERGHAHPAPRGRRAAFCPPVKGYIHRDVKPGNIMLAKMATCCSPTSALRAPPRAPPRPWGRRAPRPI